MLSKNLQDSTLVFELFIKIFYQSVIVWSIARMRKERNRPSTRHSIKSSMPAQSGEDLPGQGAIRKNKFMKTKLFFIRVVVGLIAGILAGTKFVRILNIRFHIMSDFFEKLKNIIRAGNVSESIRFLRRDSASISEWEVLFPRNSKEKN